MHENEFSIKPYVPPNASLTFKGARFNIYSLKSGKHQRDVIIHPGAAVILPILNQEHIILIQNERFSVGEVLWELPAGTLEIDEAPIVSAERELKEETGYTCRTIEPLLSFYTTPGFCNERMYAFVAYDLTRGDQQLEETEHIITSIFSWNEVLQMIKNGIIKDAKTITTLLFYKLKTQ